METFGFIGGGHHYLNWQVETNLDGREYNVPIERNGVPVTVTNHLTLAFGDEGAANHMRLCAGHDAPGIEVFVYGEAAKDTPNPFPARQHIQASAAVARRSRQSRNA